MKHARTSRAPLILLSLLLALASLSSRPVAADAGP
jgi:hypothetical protein